jgi:primosomal protein N' (replication factor Y) (superfamily II helicase)
MQSYATIMPLTGGFTDPLSYSVPENLLGKVREGHLVRAPLRQRSVLGLITKISSEKPQGVFRIRSFNELIYDVPVVSADVIEMIPWIERYYSAPRASVLETIVPAALRSETQEKITTIAQFAPGITAEGALADVKKGAKGQFAVINALEAAGGNLPRAELTAVSTSGYNSLIKKGVLIENQSAFVREAYTEDAWSAEETQHAAAIAPKLSQEQTLAAATLSTDILAQKHAIHLLHGVTGSGKTEVYLSAMETTLQAGRGVIFLVPEVSLTPQTVARVRARLAQNGHRAMVWHSHLGAGQRRDAWIAMARGEVQVLVGARSALFAPIKNLGLIVVDEEHDSAYKQEENPRYNARDLATLRASLSKAVCVLGSATPSIESIHNVAQKGYVLSTLSKRIDDRGMPRMFIVDMRKETTKGYTALSRPLINAVRERLEKKEQSILFINRRGYAPRCLCEDCGYVASCERCSLTLTYHRTDQNLRCHLCGYNTHVPKACPTCRQTNIHTRGSGTQKVEEITQKHFPHARIERIDSDTLQRKDRFREILSKFRKGEIDILVGTQMIAKGLDFPNVTLVGVVDADISLHVPDFRATERTFQLITQVAGRAGRSDLAGEVYVQTYAPESMPIQFARHGDYQGYSTAELAVRKEYGYPPFRRLVRHLIKCSNLEKLEAFCKYWSEQLPSVLGPSVEIRGPAPAPIEKIQNEYRYQLWYFCPNNQVMQWVSRINELRTKLMLDKSITDALDVDPLHLS